MRPKSEVSTLLDLRKRSFVSVGGNKIFYFAISSTKVSFLRVPPAYSVTLVSQAAKVR